MVAADDLKAFPNVGDFHKQQLNILEIYNETKEKGAVLRTPVIATTGHVDSGKSTTQAQILRMTHALDESLFEKAEVESREKAQEAGREANHIPNFAKIVECGKEAKDRGVTIVTRVWRIRDTIQFQFKAGSEDAKRAAELMEKLNKEGIIEGKATGEKDGFAQFEYQRV